MRLRLFCFLFLTLTGFTVSAQRATNAPSEIYVNLNSLQDFPNYSETSEILTIPDQHTCLDSDCESFTSNGSTYFHAVLINSENYLDILPGTWTGGLCSNDAWRMDEAGSFSSRFPQKAGEYAWSGTYSFENSLYTEIGVNNKTEKEYNQAHLYYIPGTENIIYKGFLSFLRTDENGQDVYHYYEGPDFFFFKRCQ